MARDPPPAPAPSPSLSDKFCRIMDEAGRCARKSTRTLRSATKTLGEATVLGATAYALGRSLAALCPRCKKSLKKAPDPPVCPSCHKEMLVWSQDKLEEWEERWKSIRASTSSKRERKEKGDELVQEIGEGAPKPDLRRPRIRTTASQGMVELAFQHHRMQEELESQRKGVRASNALEKKAKEVELLRKINDVGMVGKTRPKKATNKE